MVYPERTHFAVPGPRSRKMPCVPFGEKNDDPGHSDPGAGKDDPSSFAGDPLYQQSRAEIHGEMQGAGLLRRKKSC